MHSSVPNRLLSRLGLEQQTLLEVAQDLFACRPAMRYTDCVTTLKQQRQWSDKTAERRMARMGELGVIQKSAAGLYVLAPFPAAS